MPLLLCCIHSLTEGRTEMEAEGLLFIIGVAIIALMLLGASLG